jgi:hypothetical protein
VLVRYELDGVDGGVVGRVGVVAVVFGERPDGGVGDVGFDLEGNGVDNAFTGGQRGSVHLTLADSMLMVAPGALVMLRPLGTTRVVAEAVALDGPRLVRVTCSVNAVPSATWPGPFRVTARSAGGCGVTGLEARDGAEVPAALVAVAVAV